MGTRTYSRRRADGTRVPTALGIRTGKFTGGAPVPAQTPPAPARSTAVPTVSAVRALFGGNISDTGITDADIQQGLTDFDAQSGTNPNNTAQAYLRSIEDNTNTLNATQQALEQLKSEEQPDSEKTRMTLKYNPIRRQLKEAEQTFDTLARNPDDEKAQRELKQLQQLMTSGQLIYSVGGYYEPTDGRQDGRNPYLFRPMSQEEFSRWSGTQIGLRRSLIQRGQRWTPAAISRTEIQAGSTRVPPAQRVQLAILARGRKSYVDAVQSRLQLGMARAYTRFAGQEAPRSAYEAYEAQYGRN
jgi:hypothetical protein